MHLDRDSTFVNKIPPNIEMSLCIHLSNLALYSSILLDILRFSLSSLSMVSRIPGYLTLDLTLLGCGWHEGTSDASDSREGGGGRVATCDGM